MSAVLRVGLRFGGRGSVWEGGGDEIQVRGFGVPIRSTGARSTNTRLIIFVPLVIFSLADAKGGWLVVVVLFLSSLSLFLFLLFVPCSGFHDGV